MFPIFAGNSAATGYNLTRSLRFRASASAYLNRTVAAGNRQIWTWSSWVKRGTLSTQSFLYQSSDASTGSAYMYFLTDNTFAFVEQSGGSYECKTPGVFRDPSAWYHIVVAYDTTQATAANRIKIYVNGVQQTLTGTFPAQNTQGYINYASFPHRIAQYTGGGNQFDGYLAEVNFVSGVQLAATSFGSFNAITGVWQPIAYSGSYSATNSFYLPFTDNSALTTSSNVGLGKDFSGNGNYWVTNNISITAGTTYDSMTDVPTLTSATAANFAVLNPLNAETGMTGTLAGGNLNISGSGGKRSTIAARTGKFYWEFVSNSGAASNFPISGLYVAGLGTYWPGYDANSFGYFQGGDIYYNGSSVLTVSSFTDGDLLGFAWDADTGKVWVAKNNTWQNSGNPAAGTGQVTTISTGVDRVVGAYSSSGSSTINFGQRPFTYTPPTGFVALNTFNLPTSTILKGNTVMDATLYTGTGSALTITNAAPFKPDLVWIKVRSNAVSHALTDSVRGISSILSSDLTSAQATQSAGQGLTAFNSNGFSLGTQCAGSGDTNFSGRTYVGWQWQAGQGSTSSNTNGTITSTVSVNASAGFSVVTWTGTGANATVGHGLGVAPQLIINKPRNAADNWISWHTSLGALGYIYLNLTNASASAAAVWNSTLPTSSVFSVGTSSNINSSAQTMVSYCWTPIAGYSAFGSYTGNGSTDGPFVYTGFRPKFVMIKRTDSANNWVMFDSSRDTYNAVVNTLAADSTNSESTFGSGYNIDFLSNGFKPRNATGAENASGGTYIYMAYAENPFKNALAR